mgnify:CR=1 FL=1
MTTERFGDILATIEDDGDDGDLFQVRMYSGRNMYGKECLAMVAERGASPVLLGAMLTPLGLLSIFPYGDGEQIIVEPCFHWKVGSGRHHFEFVFSRVRGEWELTRTHFQRTDREYVTTRPTQEKIEMVVMEAFRKLDGHRLYFDMLIARSETRYKYLQDERDKAQEALSHEANLLDQIKEARRSS